MLLVQSPPPNLRGRRQAYSSFLLSPLISLLDGNGLTRSHSAVQITAQFRIVHNEFEL